MTRYAIIDLSGEYIVVRYQGAHYIEPKLSTNRYPALYATMKQVLYAIDHNKIYGMSKYGISKNDLAVQEIVI